MQKIKQQYVNNRKLNAKFDSKMQYRTPDDRELVNPLEVVQKHSRQLNKAHNRVPGRKLRLNYHKCIMDERSLNSDDEQEQKVTVKKNTTIKMQA